MKYANDTLFYVD